MCLHLVDWFGYFTPFWHFCTEDWKWLMFRLPEIMPYACGIDSGYGYLRGKDERELVSRAISLWKERMAIRKCVAVLLEEEDPVGQTESSTALRCQSDEEYEVPFFRQPYHPIVVLRDVVARETIALWADMLC